MRKNLVKIEVQEYKKGVEYNLADGELNLPKLEYYKYFENSDEEIDGEWMAMDRCKKSFKVETRIYE